MKRFVNQCVVFIVLSAFLSSNVSFASQENMSLFFSLRARAFSHRGSAQITPLHEWHVTHGAAMADFHGWSMPIEYRGKTYEHLAVRKAAGLFDIAHMGVLEVSGPGAFEFLQGVTTNDVSKLQPGRAQYSFIANDEGDIIDDIIVSQLKDRYLLVVNSSNTERVKKWLADQRDARKADVTIDDMRNSNDKANRKVMLAIQGPRSLAILQKLTESPLQELGYFRTTEVELGGVKVLLSRTGYTGERGYEIFVHPARALGLWERLLEVGKQDGLEPCGLAARDSLRLEAGLPLYGNELEGPLGISPFEAGFGGFVAVDKANFVGKTALLERRDRATRRVATLLVTGTEEGVLNLEMKGVPLPTNPERNNAASKVFAKDANGQWVEVGAITSRTVMSSTWRKEGFASDVMLTAACLNETNAAAGTELKIVTRGRETFAVVLPEKFYDNSGDKSPQGNMPKQELADAVSQEVQLSGPTHVLASMNRLELFLHLWQLGRSSGRATAYMALFSSANLATLRAI